MSPIFISAAALLILLFLNAPVFVSITGACIAYAVANPSSMLNAMLAMQREISGMQSVPMLAIPFFVATGALMNYCGITKRMLRAAYNHIGLDAGLLQHLDRVLRRLCLKLLGGTQVRYQCKMN